MNRFQKCCDIVEKCSTPTMPYHHFKQFTRFGACGQMICLKEGDIFEEEIHFAAAHFIGCSALCHSLRRSIWHLEGSREMVYTCTAFWPRVLISRKKEQESAHVFIGMLMTGLSLHFILQPKLDHWPDTFTMIVFIVGLALFVKSSQKKNIELKVLCWSHSVCSFISFSKLQNS